MRCLALLLVLAVHLPVGLAQDKEPSPTNRYGIALNLRAYPQATPKETLASVLQAIEQKRFDYLMAQLAEPSFVDERVKQAGVINAARIAELYRVRMDDVLVCRAYDPAVAFKITIRRPVGSGDIKDRDVYGCQQHVPLMAIEVP